MNDDCRNWIGGEWLPGPESAENTCPADVADVLGTRPVSGTDEANAAIEAAKAALPAWRDTPAPKRGEYLFKLVRLLERDQERLAEVLSMEEGKIIAEARGEVAKTTRYVEFAAGDARRMTGITADNEIPGTFATDHLATPRSGGPHHAVEFPGLHSAVEDCARHRSGEHGRPPRTGDSGHRTPDRQTHPRGRHPGWRGEHRARRWSPRRPSSSTPTWRPSASRARRRWDGSSRLSAVRCTSRCSATWAGRTPSWSSRMPTWTWRPVRARRGPSGPRASAAATSRAIVMEDVADAFVAKVLEHAQAVRAGHPLDEATTMGPSVSDKQLAQVLKYMEIGKGEADLRCGGERMMEGNSAEATSQRRPSSTMSRRPRESRLRRSWARALGHSREPPSRKPSRPPTGSSTA